MKPDKIKNFLKKSSELKFLGELIKIRKLGTGESNLNYYIKTSNGEYLLRFDITNKSASAFKGEYETLRRLEGLKIAPKAIYVNTRKDFFNEYFMILDFIEGKSLDKLKNKEYSPHYGKLTKKIARLHKLKVNLSNITNSFDNRIIRIDKTIKEIKRDVGKFEEKGSIEKMFETYYDTLKRLIKGYKPKFTFCHGDICLPNTLINENEFYLIDWELSGNLDPALELSYHFYEFNYTKSQRVKFLKEYLEIRPDKTLSKRMEFTDFFVAFTTYFDCLNACFNLAKKRGHKDYLETADLKEYWEWADYYLGLVCNLGLFDKNFEKKLKSELNSIYKELK